MRESHTPASWIVSWAYCKSMHMTSGMSTVGSASSGASTSAGAAVGVATAAAGAAVAGAAATAPGVSGEVSSSSHTPSTSMLPAARTSVALRLMFIVLIPFGMPAPG